MKRILLVALVVLQFSALAQQKGDFEKYTPKRIISKVEIVLAPSLIMPNENGFPDYINRISLGKITYTFKPKLGYSAGIGLIHSFSERFDFHIRMLYEMKGYKWENYNTSTPDTIYRTNYDVKSAYLTYSILPTYFLGRKKRMHIFLGASYSHLINSYDYYSSYKNDQLYDKGRNISGGVRKYETAVLFGIGHSLIARGKTEIILQINWTQGLSDIVNTLDSNPNPNNLTIRNNYLLFSIVLQQNRLTK